MQTLNPTQITLSFDANNRCSFNTETHNVQIVKSKKGNFGVSASSLTTTDVVSVGKGGLLIKESKQGFTSPVFSSVEDLNQWLVANLKVIAVIPAPKKIKKLKASTIKSYSAEKLARHLDKLGCDRIRVDLAYGSIYLDGNFSAPIADYTKEAIQSLINFAYNELGL